MAFKILDTTKSTAGYRFTVHLDIRHLDPDTRGPHPDSLATWTWGLPQQSPEPLNARGGHDDTGQFLHACHTQHGRDLAEQEYLENIMAMLPEMVDLELAARRGETHHDRLIALLGVARGLRARS